MAGDPTSSSSATPNQSWVGQSPTAGGAGAAKTITQLVPPFTQGTPVTAATPSHFHLITQNVSQATGFAANANTADDWNVHGSHASKNWGWAGNGCGPASVAASLRYYTEQGVINVADLSAIVNDTNRRDDPREYMKFLFPTCDTAGFPNQQAGATNVAGQAPVDANDELVDITRVFNQVKALTPLVVKGVTVNWSQPRADVAKLLAIGPIILVWKTPGHWSTVHGLVYDTTAKGYTVWIAEPGECLAMGAANWKAESSLKTKVGVPTDCGGDRRVGAFNDPSLVGMNYISVSWSFFVANIKGWYQLTPQSGGASSSSSSTPSSSSSTPSSSGSTPSSGSSVPSSSS
jgi:hypothetical protein